MKPSILIIGKNGRLAKEFISQLGPSNVTAIGRDVMDLSERNEVRHFLRQHQFNLVINCAAMNGMEACEERPDLAHAVNGLAPTIMADVMAKQEGVFVHFSTDYAVTGRGDQYRYHESDTGTPCGTYGISKRHGEEGVKASGKNYLIFRVSSIYGDDLAGSVSPVRNFLAGKRGLSENKVLRQCTTPTSVRLIVRTVLQGVLPKYEKNPEALSGLYHLVPDGQAWKSEFGREALSLYLDEDNVPSLLMGTLPLERPAFSVLNNDRIKNTFGVTFPTVYEDLYESASLWRIKNNRQALPPWDQYSPKLA